MVDNDKKTTGVWRGKGDGGNVRLNTSLFDGCHVHAVWS